jgi:hypothetical protein
MSRVPGTPGTPGTPQPPIPPGGVVLGAPQQVPPTQHKTSFHGCAIGLFVILNEDEICQGYKLLIQDPRESHVYEADCGQELLDTWAKDIARFPRVGEKPESNNGSN